MNSAVSPLLRLTPAPLSGTAAPPPSKSEAHRMLLMAALGDVPCLIRGLTPPLCGDTEAMLSVIRALGAAREQTPGGLLVTPGALPPENVCDVRDCAAALRLSLPVFLRRRQTVAYRLTPVLLRRVRSSLETFARETGAEIAFREDGNHCEITVSGSLPSGDYTLSAGESGQPVSGMLLALCDPAEGESALSTVTVTGPLASRPYVDLTAELLRKYGRSARACAGQSWLVCAAPPPPARRMTPAPDQSAAAVWLTLAALGAKIAVRCGGPSLQGDARFAGYLRQMGAEVAETDGLLTVRAEKLRAVSLDASDTPDVLPLLALLCARAEGESRLTGVRRLFAKECDRAEATEEILRRMGADVTRSGENGWIIRGPRSLRGGAELDARGDHRMTMLAAAAVFAADGPVIIKNAEVAKSDPGFWDTYLSLGGKLEWFEGNC